MNLSELLELTGGVLLNGAGAELEITGISTLDEAVAGELSFVTDRKYLSGVQTTAASVLLMPEGLGEGLDRPVIVLKDVWSGVLKTLKAFYPDFARRVYKGIHPTAVVDERAVLAEGVTVGPCAVIGAGAVLGANCYIAPGVVIGAGCVLGENCTVYANAVLEDGVKLGKGVFIQPGAVIGADGFKYEMLAGNWTKIPQVGTVVLGDDVEVGANSCIDRASYTVTAVGRNTKIDNLVQIAHNVKMGENCVVVSQSGIAGSSTVGDYTILAAQAGIADNVKVGRQVVILGRTGVKDDVGDKQTVYGTPARPFRHAARIVGVEGKLPELAAEVNALAKRVAELEELLKDK